MPQMQNVDREEVARLIFGDPAVLFEVLAGII